MQTNLTDFMNQATKWMDDGKSFDVLYLDFQKAFDKVDHQRLMVKMEGIGVRGKVWEWLWDWLSGRLQKVRVNEAVSE